MGLECEFGGGCCWVTQKKMIGYFELCIWPQKTGGNKTLYKFNSLKQPSLKFYLWESNYDEKICKWVQKIGVSYRAGWNRWSPMDLTNESIGEGISIN